MGNEGFFMKKIIASILACTALMGAFSGCGDDSSSVSGDLIGGSVEDMDEADMPYGSTMKEVKSGKIPVCFDRRFIDDDIMMMVSDYFYAVQTEDEALFKSVSNPDYLSFVENNSGQSTADYLKGIKANEENNVGGDFKYTYLEVSNLKSKDEDTQIGEIIRLMDQTYADNKKSDTFTSTIENAYALTINVTSEANGSSYTNPDVKVYVFKCKDGTYIFN